MPEDGLVLEHCRLAIIEPDNREAEQPFSDPTGRWTIAYNGELFVSQHQKVNGYQQKALFRRAVRPLLPT